MDLAQNKPFDKVFQSYVDFLTVRLASTYKDDPTTYTSREKSVSGVIRQLSQSEFDMALTESCLESLLAAKCSITQLKQLIEMPSIAHVSFYVEMLHKVETENEKNVLIDKICLMNASDHTRAKVLTIKWDLLAKKQKWFDCLQVALFMKDARMKAVTAY